MSMFDKYQVFYNLPRPGTKITFAKKTKFAFFKNVIENEDLLELGAEYTVKKVNLNSSSTYVYLEEFWDENLDTYRFNQKAFNIGAFTWVPVEINPQDLIGFTVRDCYSFCRDGKIGIKEGGELLFAGEKIIEIESEKGVITKAQYE